MHSSLRDREDNWKEGFKKGISAEDARKKRVDLTNQIRKEKKESRLSKRRCVFSLLIIIYIAN